MLPGILSYRVWYINRGVLIEHLFQIPTYVTHGTRNNLDIMALTDVIYLCLDTILRQLIVIFTGIIDF